MYVDLTEEEGEIVRLMIDHWERIQENRMQMKKREEGTLKKETTVSRTTENWGREQEAQEQGRIEGKRPDTAGW